MPFPRTPAGEIVRTRWPLITATERAAIISHLDRILEMAETRQRVSAQLHRKHRTDWTRQQQVYDSHCISALRWALWHAKRRPVIED